MDWRKLKMEKDSFLDTNIIINYVNYQKNISEEIIKKCYFYIIDKKEKFIVCHAVIKELNNIMTKLSAVHKEVLKKLEDETYSLIESKNISTRDVPFAEKLYMQHKDLDISKTKETFASGRDIFEIEIDKFLKNKTDARVIPLEQVKIELVNIIHEIIKNYADCQILASALQYQEGKDLFLFVTADKKDLDPNGYEYLKDYGLLKKYKFPELHNLMFTK